MKHAPFVRNPYNYDVDEASNETGLACKDESLTQQQFLAESDINYIADTFMRTGMAPTVLDLPESGDFEGLFDFQSAMNLIKHAKEEFMKLPAKIRSRFDNDPQKLLDFVYDDANRVEAEALGLVQKRNPDESGNSESTQSQTQERQGNPGTSTTATTKQPTQESRSQASQDDRGRAGGKGGD